MYSACVVIVMFVPSNVNVPVAEILWKFSVWWYLFFVNSTPWSVLRYVRFIGTVQSIQLSVIFGFHVVSMKCLSPLLTCTDCCSLVCFSVIFIYQFRPQIQLDAYRVTELGQHSCVVKLHYSRDDLQSLNISISPISNSLYATIKILGIHASSQLCINLENEAVSEFRKKVKFRLTVKSRTSVLSSFI